MARRLLDGWRIAALVNGAKREELIL